jgi:hypothetical protein
MKHAGGKSAVERCVPEGQAYAVEGYEVRVLSKPADADLEASEGHVDAGKFGRWKVLTKEWDRCAYTGPKVKKLTAHLARNVDAYQTFQVLDLVLCEVLGCLSRCGDIRFMKRPVLFSESIEFRSIHRGG